MPPPPHPSTAVAERSPALPRWLLTLATAVLAIGLRALLQPLLGDKLPFLLAYPAIVLASSLWGIGSGLFVGLATALVAAEPWIPPTIDPAERPMHVGAFCLVAIFISLFANLRARGGPAPSADSADTGFVTPLETWLRAVLWGAVLVPATAFVAASWWGHEHAVAEAQAASGRAATLVRGQAQHTFEIAERIAHRADQAAGGEDASLRAREAEIHARLADMVAGLPAVVNLNIWDASGRAIARSDRYPTDRVAAVDDRAYFQQQRKAPVPLGISEVLTGRQTGLRLLNATIRRQAADGQFAGIVAVSLSPEFFSEYYRSLAVENPTLTRFALVRTDGTILADWPRTGVEGGPPRTPMNDEVYALVKNGDLDGHIETTSPRDGQRRFVSFQRVGSYPLYVVAGVSRDAMLAGWLRFVGLLAALLVPVTAGLSYVSLVALRKTRREQSITAALNDAVRRRAAAEKGMLESQKLETLAQLTGGVAHDFNNLLAIVSSSLHVHRHLHPELGEERHVQAMARAVQSGTRLTRQLLSFSRKQALRPEVIALQSWLPGTEGLLRSTLGSRIAMEIAVEPDVCPISVDVAELELALINLALNAKHAMPAGGRLRISARNEGASEDGTSMVAIGIVDTGVGIAADVLPRVFEPFFTTRMNEAGSGLGLSQVHGFCAQAGGRARISSEPGVGTTVEMLLPAEHPQAHPPLALVPADPGRMAGHVLLVEDNDDVAQSTAAILQAAGLTVTHQWSADAALAALQGSATLPDIVLSDIEMPGKLSGMDLAFRLRELWPRLPVVLITGYAKQLEDAVSGGLRVLPKPTPPQDLLRELRRAIGDAARSPAGAEPAAAQPPR
jgi:two-component system NtrC family sensor kinase